MSNENSNLALSLAQIRGWKVFPCKPDKTPMTKRGYKDATTDLTTIQSWWSIEPTALIGVACKPSGLFAVDIDCKNGVDGWAEWKELVKNCGGGVDVECGPMQQTPSGGAHLIFKYPDGKSVPNNASKLAKGLDLRSDGYICTGGSYQWLNEHDPLDENLPIVEAPDWLINLICSPKKKASTPPPAAPIPNLDTLPNTPESTAIYYLNKYLGEARPGNRNDTGLKLAIQLRNNGLTQSQAEPYMRDYAEKVPNSGKDKYTVDEALTSLKSAYSRPADDPATPGKKQTQTTASSTPAGQPSPAGQAQTSTQKRKPKSIEYVDVLRKMSFEFRLNECNDRIEVNGEAISDAQESVIFSKLRDAGFDMVNVARDAYIAHAYYNSYHPIRDYLSKLPPHDGGDHIHNLAGYFTNPDNTFETWLRRFLIGAVRRAFEPGSQNRVLVLDGPQNIGKSKFSEWLVPASLRSKHYKVAPIVPDDKDCKLALCERWIWEVAELGATTRRADREALKFFISLEQVTLRPPYGRYEISKPALSNFIGTVNNENGLLSDPTGNRRYMFSKIEGIDWRGYTQNIDVEKVWAEAKAAYEAGESADLTPEEETMAAEINSSYEVEEPLEGIILQHFEIDPRQSTWWTSTSEILQAIDDTHIDPLTKAPSAAAYRGATGAISQKLSSLMTSMNCTRSRRREAGKKNPQWGYVGVRKI